MFSCHSFILFLFCFCNKILLDSCFAHVMFLFLFFLFRDLDLELDLPCFNLGLGNLIGLIVFVHVTMHGRFLQQSWIFHGWQVACACLCVWKEEFKVSSFVGFYNNPYVVVSCSFFPPSLEIAGGWIPPPSCQTLLDGLHLHF